MWSLILICIIHLVVTQQIFCLDTFGYNLENLNSITIVLWGVYCFRQNFFDVLYKVVYYCVYQCSYFLQNFAIFRLKFSTFWFSIAFFVCNIFSTCKTKTNINAKFSGRTWYFLLKQSFIWLLHNLCYCTYKEGGPKTFFKKSL